MIKIMDMQLYTFVRNVTNHYEHFENKLYCLDGFGTQPEGPLLRTRGHSLTWLCSRQWGATDWACEICDRCIHHVITSWFFMLRASFLFYFILFYIIILIYSFSNTLLNPTSLSLSLFLSLSVSVCLSLSLSLSLS